jgi:hypothetical protein
MDQLKRLQTLIGVADAVLQRQEQGDKNVDGAALVVAVLIDREIRSAGTAPSSCSASTGNGCVKRQEYE